MTKAERELLARMIERLKREQKIDELIARSTNLLSNLTEDELDAVDESAAAKRIALRTNEAVIRELIGCI